METLRNAGVPAALLGRPGGTVERVDIAIADGTIASIASHQPGPGRDLDGGLVLPAFADIHTHLDKGQIWSRKPNPDGSFMAAIVAVDQDRVAHWSPADIERRMEFQLRTAWAHGTAAIRTHLDCVPPDHEPVWEVFDKVRERWAGRIELQAVALVAPDILHDKTKLTEVARVAYAHRGMLGGAMMSDPESAAAMRSLVEVAGTVGVDIDLHCDETTDPASTVLLDLAVAVIETGYRGRVLAGHCSSLAYQDPLLAAQSIGRVAEARIAVVSLPMCNMYLQDRTMGRTPRLRGAAPIRELKTAGVAVAIASDNVRDPFYAYGDLDGLEVLREGARILHFDHSQSEAWSWARAMGADAAAIAGFGYTAEVKPGAPADLLLFRARTWTELLARPHSDRIVIRGGQQIDTTLPDYRELDDLMEA
jgi:cytosine deaminase